MQKFLSKMIFVIIVGLFLSINLTAQSNNKKVAKALNKILDDDYFESTTIAVDIFDLTSNKSLYKKNSKKLLHPASNMKLITTIAALEYLGPKYEFKTSLYHTGIIMDSICYGDVFVQGGFDPDFTTIDLDTLVQEIRKFGVNEIRGNLYGDVSKMDSLHWGKGWMWDDDPSTDFPYMTSLIINDAAIKIVYQPGLIGKKINYELIPQTNFFNITNTSYTSKEDTSNFDISRNWLNHGNEISITGDISFKEEQDTVELNIINPEYYFMYLFKEKLKEKSINFLGIIDTLTLPEFPKHIYTHSRQFKNIINNINKESDNLSAEMTLLALASEHFDEKSTAKNGVKIIDSLIVKVGLEANDYKIVDGSGASHYNLVSTELMVKLLEYMYQSSKQNYKILFNSLPIAGVDGTLEKRMRRSKAHRNVRAKTGTLSGVSTLSGYLLSKNKHRIAFSIFVQNFVGSSRVARRYQDKICKFLAGAKL
ncbi:MAG: D-alanyl-D-alanine carboxypeptidase/D-alanyl-D-alanine-endopeptidase [Melioribacteraceae bacterium]